MKGKNAPGCRARGASSNQGLTPAGSLSKRSYARGGKVMDGGEGGEGDKDDCMMRGGRSKKNLGRAACKAGGGAVDKPSDHWVEADPVRSAAAEKKANLKQSAYPIQKHPRKGFTNPMVEVDTIPEDFTNAGPRPLTRDQWMDREVNTIRVNRAEEAANLKQSAYPAQKHPPKASGYARGGKAMPFMKAKGAKC